MVDPLPDLPSRVNKADIDLVFPPKELNVTRVELEIWVRDTGMEFFEMFWVMLDPAQRGVIANRVNANIGDNDWKKAAKNKHLCLL